MCFKENEYPDKGGVIDSGVGGAIAQWILELLHPQVASDILITTLQI